MPYVKKDTPKINLTPQNLKIRDERLEGVIMMQNRVGMWEKLQFGNNIGSIDWMNNKLLEEVEELIRATETKEISSRMKNVSAELGDVFIVLCAIAIRAGVSLDTAIIGKFNQICDNVYVENADGSHSKVMPDGSLRGN